MTGRRVRIEVERRGAGRDARPAIAVVDVATGERLRCRSLELRVDGEGPARVTIELNEPGLGIGGIWECRRVAEG